MTKRKKRALIVSLIMVAAGLVSCLAALVAVDFDLTELGAGKRVPGSAVFVAGQDGLPEELRIKTIFSQVRLVPGEEDRFTVDYYRDKRLYVEAGEYYGAIIVTEKDTPFWYRFVNIHSSDYDETCVITVHVPRNRAVTLNVDAYEDVAVEEGVELGDAVITSQFGRVDFRGSASGRLQIAEETSMVG